MTVRQTGPLTEQLRNIIAEMLGQPVPTEEELPAPVA
jgi:hypothetical protein